MPPMAANGAGRWSSTIIASPRQPLRELHHPPFDRAAADIGHDLECRCLTGCRVVDDEGRGNLALATRFVAHDRAGIDKQRPALPLDREEMIMPVADQVVVLSSDRAGNLRIVV